MKKRVYLIFSILILLLTEAAFGKIVSRYLADYNPADWVSPTPLDKLQENLQLITNDDSLPTEEKGYYREQAERVGLLMQHGPETEEGKRVLDEAVEAAGERSAGQEGPVDLSRNALRRAHEAYHRHLAATADPRFVSRSAFGAPLLVPSPQLVSGSIVPSVGERQSPPRGARRAASAVVSSFTSATGLTPSPVEESQRGGSSTPTLGLAPTHIAFDDREDWGDSESEDSSLSIGDLGRVIEDEDTDEDEEDSLPQMVGFQPHENEDYNDRRKLAHLYAAAAAIANGEISRLEARIHARRGSTPLKILKTHEELLQEPRPFSPKFTENAEWDEHQLVEGVWPRNSALALQTLRHDRLKRLEQMPGELSDELREERDRLRGLLQD